MSHRPSDSSSSRSSQEPSPAVERTAASDGAMMPPSVANTARRHGASGENSWSQRRTRSPRFPSFRRTSPQQPGPPQRTRHDSPLGATHSTAPHRRRSPQTQRASSADTLSQHHRNTLTIAEAEAVRVARNFSMDMYRSLHKRKFASLHEELDFLRRDFVASRRTLARLHEENARLERELLSRHQEVEQLQNQIEEAYRGLDEGPSRAPLSARPSLRSSRHARSAYRGGPGSARQRQRDSHDAPASWADMMIEEEAEKQAGVSADVAMGGTSKAKEKSGAKGSSTDEHPSSRGSSPSSRASAPPSTPSRISLVQTTRTPLALYAKTTRIRKAAKAHAGEGGVDLQALIRDLRANLARRDTSLNEAQMELSALQGSQHRLRTELSAAQAQLLQAKQQRDHIQSEATALEEKKAAQEKELDACRSQTQQLLKERDILQRRLTTAELLYEHTGSRGGGGGVDTLAADADLRQIRDGASSSAPSSGRHMRDQLQLYRAKWQAAEDEMDHLHTRLSQLQRQLVSLGVDTALGVSGSATEQQDDHGSSNALEVTAQQRAEHALELETLRRQHQEQLQLHAEEIQRLQRRLDRAQENAAFHEDQLRQQRQDDTRQHHNEVQALQTQLRTVQGELVKAQQDREHLARQLRRSTEQETTLEVARDQVNQLKQRLGEVGAELAQVRGREKEISLNIQRERMARAKAEHDVETAQEALARERKEVFYLQEETKLLREQLGVQEASVASHESRDRASSSLTTDTTDEGRCRSFTKVGVDCGDAAALASELKGYVSLMRVNTTLQRRIEELEAQVATLKFQSPPSPPRFPLSPSTSDAFPRDDLHRSISSPAAPVVCASEPLPAPSVADAPQDSEVRRLKGELEVVLQTQRELLSSCAEAEKDRRLLVEDNVVLANGIELLEKRLGKLQAAITAERAHSRSETLPKRHLPTQRIKKEEKRKGRPVRKHIDLPLPPPHDILPSTEDSRLRQRLQSARAQDQHVLYDTFQKAYCDPLLADKLAGQPPCPCCLHGGTIPLPNTFLSFSAPHLQPVECELRGDAASAPTTPPANASTAPPPSACTPSPAPAPQNRCDGSSSPLHSPRLHVHGSVLPPVHYPSLILKSSV
ncbi:actin-interacting protein-like protein [Leptomonas seymouri]|uniref:Actin-interacting protein-like protein n=1 Tax=Leptomonas seymouri TaxID=5684 RepID=A0A0N0P545_LEPSE|nr:actin-interacting protein-like protein [Leptomonas seymouri]|eukprot:KPI86036.1 actin-interacting protein-like protein [Leptomonas seymouri]